MPKPKVTYKYDLSDIRNLIEKDIQSGPHAEMLKNFTIEVTPHCGTKYVGSQLDGDHVGEFKHVEVTFVPK